jgi:hypothetical protein
VVGFDEDPLGEGCGIGNAANAKQGYRHLDSASPAQSPATKHGRCRMHGGAPGTGTTDR